MDTRSCIVVCLTVMVAFSTATEGLDITKVLGQYPDFAKFNTYLTETKLAEEINSRKAVTILALDDAAVLSLSGKSEETVKAILSTHVLIGFYDEKKLVEAQGARSEIENLFQSSGLAKNKQGYILVDLINEGEFAFASAVPGSPFKSLLMRNLSPEPDVVSILQVTQPIVVPGIDSSGLAASPGIDAPAPSPSTSTRIRLTFFAPALAFASLFFHSF
ncbi:hypothetical protein VNO77_10893 [Canavalia gladiata]|uniref:FAS1 domain-containing protein n=1 Tax=Canavalia gladiata TaxID=3824 RepID=A0AAN9MEP5_CANGL